MSEEFIETLHEDVNINNNVMEKVDEEDDETLSTKSESNFSKIEFRTITSSSVIVEWIYLNQFSQTSSQQAVASVEQEQIVTGDVDSAQTFIYKVLKLETRGEWKTIARTKKTSCQIDNLEPNVCYSLKLHVLVEDVDRFRVVDESEVFKVNSVVK